MGVSTFSDQSEYINLNTTGLVKNLRIEIAGDDVSYPIKLSDIVLNAHHPFDFNTTRFFVCMGLLALAFAFRPGSAIYRIGIVSEPRKSKAAIVATVAIEVCLLGSFLFLGSNLVGVATQSYNSGSWDGKSLVNVFEVGGDNAQQYAELAKAMAHGQLYLEEEPPQWLQDSNDPYDKGARDEMQKETGEPYLFDVAYYNGHYYVYFGVVPVILFYLPFYLLTGANFPTAIGVLIAVVAFVLGCSALLDRFARYHFKRVSLGLYLLLQIPLVMCCGVLYLLKFPTFYSLPIALGLAFSVWGLYFWMKGRASAGPEKWYLAGSLCMALVAGCRPQLLVLSLVAFPLFWRAYITKRRLLTPLFAYFLQPPSATGVFPYLQPAPFDTTYMGQTIKEVTFGGILACLPVLWVLPFAKRVLQLRMSQRSTRTIAGVIVVLLLGGVIVALADAEMAGILQRYFADFSFMFLAAVVLLVFIVNENLQPGSIVQNLLMKVLLVLVAVSVLYSALLCFVPETGWYSDVYPWAYRDIIETAQFWT